jgi:hypothetical protein
LRCHRCGQRGHFARHCPQKENAGSANAAQGKRGTFALVSHSADSSVQTATKSAQDMLVDTGASHHVVNDKRFFVNMMKPPVETVTCGGGEQVVHGEGTGIVQG